MRRLGYLLGVVLVVVGLATAVADLIALLTLDQPERMSLWVIWRRLHPSSLQGLRALIEDWLGIAVFAALRWLLLVPAWISLTLPGLLLLLLGRERRSRFDF